VFTGTYTHTNARKFSSLYSWELNVTLELAARCCHFFQNH